MRAVALCFAFALCASCSDVRTELIPAAQRARDAGDADSGPSDAGARAMCGKHACKCDDGKDNDDDALIDGLDPECTAPFDDDEERFATGGPKAGPNACEDCFWDANADVADDGCTYTAACRTMGPTAMPGPPAMGPAAEMVCRSCEVTPRCVDSCRGHTPNGCDCFGCCEVTRDDGTLTYVVLQDECALKHVDDERKCPQCVPNAACANPCGPCELCLGKKPEDLPAECADAGTSDGLPPQRCDEGYEACSQSAPCDEDHYCVLGCCLTAVF